MKFDVDKEVQEARKTAFKIRGLSGRCEWSTIDDLPLTEAQKACVLEWLAQKLMQTTTAHKLDIWSMGKSYDPLHIEGKVAHSYVMNMGDGGRHHPFNEMKKVEHYIFKEFFEEIDRELEATNTTNL